MYLIPIYMFTQPDIDECVLGTHKCDQLCVNTEDSYICSCSEGFQLDEDGYTCISNQLLRDLLF